MDYSNSSSETSKTGESPVKTRRKFSPTISVVLCKGCLICVYACEKLGADVLRESEERTAMGGVFPVVEGDCIGCRWCERFCPDFAISVEEVEAC
jgi:NAD-dependent dihydropyrimidine dehydrogenase PreA subunit